jgi:hypothetical protein
MAGTYVGGLEVARGCCLRMVPSAIHNGPSSCPHEVNWAGTVYFSSTRERWLAFACDRHYDVLTNPHRLTASERAELKKRRRAWADARSGKAWRPPRPLESHPLRAHGRDVYPGRVPPL